jgi:hypothetical protein
MKLDALIHVTLLTFVIFNKIETCNAQNTRPSILALDLVKSKNDANKKVAWKSHCFKKCVSKKLGQKIKYDLMFHQPFMLGHDMIFLSFSF